MDGSLLAIDTVEDERKLERGRETTHSTSTRTGAVVV
jgi:hypothetical protein